MNSNFETDIGSSTFNVHFLSHKLKPLLLLGMFLLVHAGGLHHAMRPGLTPVRKIHDNLGGNIDVDLIAFSFSLKQKGVRKQKLNQLTFSQPR